MINIVTTPQILTSTLFLQYGGNTHNATTAQQQAAFAIAEGQAAQEINTFVAPTTVTGTFSWPPMGQPLQLPYTRLNSVEAITSIHDAGCDCAANAIEISGCAWIMDYEGALISLRDCGSVLQSSCSGCGCIGSGAMQVRVVATYGLSTGTASDARLQMALVTAADLALQQMIDPYGADGGAGDPGIKSFSSLSYSETRSDGSYKMTAFGDSARANYAARMLSNFKYNRVGKMGW